MNVFAEFFDWGTISKGMNAAFVVLIPNFRPMNLVGGLYKIISKVLSLRMWNVMDNVVSIS